METTIAVLLPGDAGPGFGSISLRKLCTGISPAFRVSPGSAHGTPSRAVPLAGNGSRSRKDVFRRAEGGRSPTAPRPRRFRIDLAPPSSEHPRSAAPATSTGL